MRHVLPEHHRGDSPSVISLNADGKICVKADTNKYSSDAPVQDLYTYGQSDIYSDGRVSVGFHGRLLRQHHPAANVQFHDLRSSILSRQALPPPAAYESLDSIKSREQRWQARERAFWEEADKLESADSSKSHEQSWRARERAFWEEVDKLEAGQKKQEFVDGFKDYHRYWQNYHVRLNGDTIVTAPNRLARQNVPLHRKLHSLSNKNQAWIHRFANIDPRIAKRLQKTSQTRQHVSGPPDLTKLKDSWVHRVADQNQRIIQTLQQTNQARYNIPSHRAASTRDRKVDETVRSYRIVPKNRSKKSTTQKIQDQRKNLERSMVIIKKSQGHKQSWKRAFAKWTKNQKDDPEQQHENTRRQKHGLITKDVQPRALPGEVVGFWSPEKSAGKERQRGSSSGVEVKATDLEREESPRKGCFAKTDSLSKFRYYRNRQHRHEPQSRVIARSVQGKLSLQGTPSREKVTLPERKDSSMHETFPNHPQRHDSAPIPTSTFGKESISAHPHVEKLQDSLIPYSIGTQSSANSQSDRYRPMKIRTRQASDRGCLRGSSCLSGLWNQLRPPQSPGVFDVLTGKRPPYDHHVLLSYDKIWNRDPRHVPPDGTKEGGNRGKDRYSFPKNIPALMSHAWEKTPQAPWDPHWSKDLKTLGSQYSPPGSPPRPPRYAPKDPNIPSSSRSVQRPDSSAQPKRPLRSKRLGRVKYLEHPRRRQRHKRSASSDQMARFAMDG
ncbi:hypothetical protein MMC10_004355 [Thelotrema lepadinum]|nr:hypothetical protein [Thelotrema lepadinum]